MKKGNLHKLFTVACMLFSLFVQAQKTPGKLSLLQGQQMQVDNTIKTVMTMEMMGQSMEITSDANITRKTEVKSVNGSSYTVASTITKMVTSGGAMGQTYSYDSDKKEDTATEIGKVLKDKINVTNEAEVDEYGLIKAGEKKDAAKSEDQNPMMSMLSKMSNSNDAVGATDIFHVIPAGKKEGDTWADSVVNEGVKIYRNYTFKSIRDNIATVSFAGTQKVGTTIENMGMETTITIDANLNGEILVDVKSGVVKERSMTTDGTGSAEMMGQAIPITLKATNTTSVK